MKPRVYLETTILSYLAANASRDVVVAGNQQVTHLLWQRRQAFDFFVSRIVLVEMAQGNPEMARKRIELAEGIPILDVTDSVSALAEELVTRGPIPSTYAEDAMHIALATVHGMDFLATWNCSHIANAEFRSGFIETMDRVGYRCVQICTPNELLGENFL